MGTDETCFLCPSILKIHLLKQQYLWQDRPEWRANATFVCEVNLTPRTVYLIAAVSEMRDEERLTVQNKSDLVASDPNMQGGQTRSPPPPPLPGQRPNPFRSLLGNEII